MLIAEALKEKKDLTEDVNSLKNRIKSYRWAEDGCTPDEDPYDLLKEYETKTARILELTKQIERSNNLVKADDGRTIAELLSEYQCLNVSRQFYDCISRPDGNSVFGYRSKGDVSTIDVKAMRKKVEALSKQLRAMDTKIQALNWSNELVVS